MGARSVNPRSYPPSFFSVLRDAFSTRHFALLWSYRHRDTEFIMNVHGRWEEASDDEQSIAWCRELFEATTRFATGGVYVNFMTEEEEKRVAEAYGDSYKRLVELKKKYDPDNFFRVNQNIVPAS